MSLSAATSRVAANLTTDGASTQPLHPQKGVVKKGGDIEVVATLNTMNESSAVSNQRNLAVASTHTLSQRFFARITRFFCCGASKVISDDSNEMAAKNAQRADTDPLFLSKNKSRERRLMDVELPTSTNSAPRAPIKRTSRQQLLIQSMKLDVALGPETPLSDEGKLTANLKAVQDRLDPIKNPELWKSYLPCDVDRFNNIHACKETSVSPDLNANLIKMADESGVIPDQPKIIASQYPKNTPQNTQLEAQLGMYLKNDIEILLVLTPREEMEAMNAGMTDYFSPSDQPRQFGSITTTSTKQGELILPQNLRLNVYHMDITHRYGDSEKKGKVVVLHAQNLPDHKAAGAEDLQALVKALPECKKTLEAAKGIQPAEETPPNLAVHCTAGVGRTGMFLAVYFMKYPAFEHLSLGEIITQMREQRNGHMVQTPAQLQVLIDIANAQGRPLVKKAAV